MTQDYKDKVNAWFSVPENLRNLDEGSRLIVAFTRNQIMYGNMQRNLERYREKILYEMEKIHKLVLADMTVEKVHALEQQVAPVVDTYVRTAEPNKATELAKGKRADHDTLPENIQKLYVDNGEIIKKIRACHAELQSMPDDNDACHVSDRFPIIQEMVTLDKQYHANWKKYDNYVQQGTSKPKRGSKTSK